MNTEKIRMFITNETKKFSFYQKVKIQYYSLKYKIQDWLEKSKN